jgi:hypothetical protein
MSIERWIRQASGLFLPSRSFAAPWRFLPCETCCGYTPTLCRECYKEEDGLWTEWPVTIWADIDGIIDSLCEECDWYNQTYALAQSGPAQCAYGYDTAGGSCEDPDVFHIALVVTVVSGECYVKVQIDIGDPFGSYPVTIIWGATLPHPLKPIDDNLPFVSISAPEKHCDVSSPTCRIYE